MTAADLRTWRRVQGWTQRDLAHHLGVHRITIVRWERGTVAMPALLALALRSATPTRRGTARRRTPAAGPQISA